MVVKKSKLTTYSTTSKLPGKYDVYKDDGTFEVMSVDSIIVSGKYSYHWRYEIPEASKKKTFYINISCSVDKFWKDYEFQSSKTSPTPEIINEECGPVTFELDSNKNTFVIIQTKWLE